MMNIADTRIKGVQVIESAPVTDQRSMFMRLFCADALAPLLSGRTIAQANASRTTRPGTVRGLHFQHRPHAEMKFVRCLRGKVWDVALDLRAGSPTFLRWHAEELTPGNAKMLLVPEGCAHGFQALEPDSELLYFTTQFYAPDAEGGVRYNDPACAIPWPLPLADISGKDASFPLLAKDFSGLMV